MVYGFLPFVFAIASVTKLALSSSSKLCPSGFCHDALPEKAQILLQARQNRSKSIGTKEFMALNPSGAAAPLDEGGYASVADGCCQAEMQVFIRRQLSELKLEVCHAAGLVGIVPYHSCEAGPQTFAKLTADLLADSAERCTWVADTGNCEPRPTDCPEYIGLPPVADCGCHMSKASKVDFGAGTVTINNLGGMGPTRGASEIRYSNVGTSETGEAFDVVLTTLSAYNPPKAGAVNGIKGEFGAINQGQDATSDFRFSFMVPGTNTPVQLAEIHMTLFDLDGTIGTGLEVAASKGYKGYVTDTEPSIVASRLPDGRTKFSSSGLIKNIPNPEQTDSLTAEQRQNSVMYFYQDVSSFDLTFGIEGGTFGRNLFFAFESALNNRCAA